MAVVFIPSHKFAMWVTKISKTGRYPVACCSYRVAPVSSVIVHSLFRGRTDANSVAVVLWNPNNYKIWTVFGRYGRINRK